jgi:heat shock protein HslJ
MPLCAVVIMLGIALSACAADPLSLEGTRWNVVEINGSPTLEDYPITMEFAADQIAGNAGCNNYFAGYTLDGETLSFGPAGATRMFCEGAMEQEDLFLTSLETVKSFSLDGEQLILRLGDGGSIVLEPVEKL